MTWPRYIALKSATNDNYLSYVDSPKGIASSGDDVWKPSTKFHVASPNKLNLENMFHIRCCYNNKFLVCPLDAGSPILFADEADEDETHTCTLFKFVPDDRENIQIQHVGTNRYLHVKKDRDNFLVSEPAVTTRDSSYVFEVIDCDKLIRMPEYVAFQGDNGKYLRPIHLKGEPTRLQFSSDDKSAEDVVYQIVHNPNGTISVKRILSNSFWLVMKDTDYVSLFHVENHTKERGTWFQPIKIDDSTVVLQCLVNDKFCKRLSTQKKADLLAPFSHTIDDQFAKLKMVELVLSRHIYDVRYRFEHARTYDNNSAIVGTGTVTNKDDYEKEFQVKVAIKYTNTRSWKNSFKWDLGVKTTVEADIIPLIFGGKFEVSTTIGGTHELGEIESNDVQFETTVKEKVPKNSRCTVNAIAKVAKCDVPYSYLKRDFLYDGKSNIAFMDDGVYNGVHYVEINHETVHQPLPPEDQKSKRQKYN